MKQMYYEDVYVVCLNILDILDIEDIPDDTWDEMVNEVEVYSTMEYRNPL